MKELRKDSLLNRWVIFSSERKKRPRQFEHSYKKNEEKACFFCPGNEQFTPPEIYRVEKKKKWIVRVFPNKFPALSTQNHQKESHENFFTRKAAYGYHDVIVETPEHRKQLHNLDISQIMVVLKTYAQRIQELSQDKKIKYVAIIKNHEKDAGTSIIHSHSQVFAYTESPLEVEEEVKASWRSKRCGYCSLLKKESQSERRAFHNKTFVAFCPFASRFPYEVMILPKRHTTSIERLSEQEIKDLASILKKVLVKLATLKAPYNFFLHNAPGKKNLHFHIEVTPRIDIWGGFELSTGCIINTIFPENAAKFYRK